LWEGVDNSDRLPPPTITANVNGTLGANGWYTSDVTVTWDIDVAAAVTPTTTNCGATSITSDTAGITLTCSAANPTGESSSATVTIRRDATPPTVVVTRLTAAPASGWTNQDVLVRFNGSDALSGIGSNPSVTLRVASEGANQTAEVEFFDHAGNHVVGRLAGINIDKTAPRIGFRFANLPETASAAENAAE